MVELLLAPLLVFRFIMATIFTLCGLNPWLAATVAKDFILPRRAFLEEMARTSTFMEMVMDLPQWNSQLQVVARQFSFLFP